MYITVEQKLGHECVNSIVLVKNLKQHNTGCYEENYILFYPCPVQWHFWCSKVMQSPLEAKYKCWLLEYSNYSAQFNHSNNGIPIADLSQYILTGCPQSLGKLKPAQASCCFQKSLVGCSGLIPLCGAELYVHYPHAGLADSEAFLLPVCSATIAFYAPSGPRGVETKVSFFARTMVSHTLCRSELPDTALALPHWDSFQCQGSVTKPWLLCWAVWEIARSFKCLTLLLQSNPCYFWDEVPNAGSFS